MEQTRFLMWGNNKRKSDLMINPRSVFAYGGDDSWEEQAFAEDAGGCTWPPRSYSCSFCRREFRSAQALGGHMNVHRRDRARLKQSLIIPQTDHHHVDRRHHHHHHDVDHHLQFFLCNPNHGFSDPQVLASPSSITRVSPSPPPPPQTRTKGANEKIPLRVFDLYYEDKKSKTLDQSNTEDCVKGDLDIYNRNPANESSISDDGVVYAGCKRRRIDLTKSSDIERFQPRLEVVKACSSTIEELDLELRLGEAPKVK